MLFKCLITAAFTSSLALSASALADGVASAGEKVFKKCKTCHVVDKEKNKIGPHLVGVFVRSAGAVDSFKYSKAMLESGIVWDEGTLAEYLANPRGYLKGTKMSFAGLKKDEDVANIIEYLKEPKAAE